MGNEGAGEIEMINYGHKHRQRGGLSHKKKETFIVGDIQAKKFISLGLDCERKGKHDIAISHYKSAIQAAHDYKLVELSENRKRLCENKIRNGWK